jgi:toxin ParE1/3/4
MRIRWTGKAADDLAQIVGYIRKDNPAAARRVAQAIYKSIAELRAFPKRGRVGLAENTRELVFVYEIIEDQVQVLRYGQSCAA